MQRAVAEPGADAGARSRSDDAGQCWPLSVLRTPDPAPAILGLDPGAGRSPTAALARLEPVRAVERAQTQERAQVEELHRAESSPRTIGHPALARCVEPAGPFQTSCAGAACPVIHRTRLCSLFACVLERRDRRSIARS